MRRVVKTSFLSVCTVLFVFCLAAPARAQYCEQDCAPGGQGGWDYPSCDRGCNAGGGDYTTCGAAGFGCCNNYVVTANVRGEHSDRVLPYICSVTAWVDLQSVFQCPGGTYYGGTFCAQLGSGYAFTSEAFSDCCDTGGCWGQNYC